MSSYPLSHRPHIHHHFGAIRLANWRPWAFGALALTWYATSTFVLGGLPAVVSVLVLALIVMVSLEPDSRAPTRSIAATRRNVALAVVAGIVFVPVALGMNLLRGVIPIAWGPAVLATLAAVCVMLPRFAQTREYARAALLGPVIGVIGRRQERAIWTNLKRLLEAREDEQDGA
jgi:hypothetical protein